MMPSNLCQVPPSVEILGPSTSTVFKPGPTTPSFQTRLMPLIQIFLKCMLLLYTMYCMWVCQMQIKATYLFTGLNDIFFNRRKVRISISVVRRRISFPATQWLSERGRSRLVLTWSAIWKNLRSVGHVFNHLA